MKTMTVDQRREKFGIHKPMNREHYLKLIDENNSEISKLQARLKELLARDRWLHSNLPLEPVKAYTGGSNETPQW